MVSNKANDNFSSQKNSKYFLFCLMYLKV